MPPRAPETSVSSRPQERKRSRCGPTLKWNPPPKNPRPRNIDPFTSMKLSSFPRAAIVGVALLFIATAAEARPVYGVSTRRGSAVVVGRRPVVAVRRPVVVAPRPVVVLPRPVVVAPLPSGYIRVLPAGHRAVVYGGHNCFFGGGVYTARWSMRAPRSLSWCGRPPSRNPARLPFFFV